MTAKHDLTIHTDEEWGEVTASCPVCGTRVFDSSYRALAWHASKSDPQPQPRAFSFCRGAARE